MLTYEEMQYFAAFAQDGTLTQVAQRFTISQPTITRAMKKAEEEFGVPLFQRTKNSISLNDNGRYAAEEVRLLLRQTDDMVARIRAYDRSARTISVGTAAAVELPSLVQQLSRAYPEKSIAMEMKKPDELTAGLDNNTYQLILLPYAPDPEKYIFRRAGRETLVFLLPKKHKYARRKFVTFQEMNGENILLYSKVGFWGDMVHEKMPASRFLVQNERYTFQELIENSILPCFSSDIVLRNTSPELLKNRVVVGINDPDVEVTYYLTALKSKRRTFAPLFDGH
jgi:DNA-binding transcriptional LysR family regulator